jgi:hypothetical protein
VLAWEVWLVPVEESWQCTGRDAGFMVDIGSEVRGG